MTKGSVAQMEKREADGTITLNSIRKLATAMDSDVVYFVVPRGGLEATVRRRAEDIARRVAKEVSESMVLEGQGTSAERLEQLVEFHAEEILRDGRTLWDDV
jgi:predicted DNA-binding mobile mystery protein A